MFSDYKELTMAQTDHFLTVKEAAKLMQDPVSWVYRKTSERKIPHRKIGKHIRFSSGDLLAWLDSKKIPFETEL